jgi:hypothetical protein
MARSFALDPDNDSDFFDQILHLNPTYCKKYTAALQEDPILDVLVLFSREEGVLPILPV